MYKVFARESETFPQETFTIWYDVDFDGDNSEWRVCVSDVLTRLSEAHVITEIEVPPFEEGEDFIELKYSIDGSPLEFSCDFLLYSIFVTTTGVLLTNSIRDELGRQVGWVHA